MSMKYLLQNMVCGAHDYGEVYRIFRNGTYNFSSTNYELFLLLPFPFLSVPFLATTVFFDDVNQQ